MQGWIFRGPKSQLPPLSRGEASRYAWRRQRVRRATCEKDVKWILRRKKVVRVPVKAPHVKKAAAPKKAKK